MYSIVSISSLNESDLIKRHDPLDKSNFIHIIFLSG